ncbi:MAG: hypothetical protein HY648_10710, partial [Acidobacteria bacterium]|nr:hypothetical protein [Acidobacteriota bacterium]
MSETAIPVSQYWWREHRWMIVVAAFVFANLVTPQTLTATQTPVYVTYSNFFDGSAKVVAITNAGGPKWDHPVDLGLGGWPSEPAISPDGSHLYVVLSFGDTRKLTILNAVTGAFLASYSSFPPYTGINGISTPTGLLRLEQCFGKPGHWGGENYAYHTDGKTICALGCALTDLSMNLTFLGVTQIPNYYLSSDDYWADFFKGPQDPGSLNKLMIRSPGT